MFKWIVEGLMWAAAIVFFAMVMMPASYWHEVGELHVDNYEQGANTELLFEGGATRNFKGSYSIVVRDASQSIVLESTSGVFPYKPEAVMPVPLLMSWWAPVLSDQIANLKPGLYTLTTCWTIHEPFYGLVPNKTECIKSNVFHVHE